MSVILEFTVSADEFSLGRVLTTETAVRIELEAIIPTGGDVMPFFWVETADGDDLDAFERAVRSHPMMDQLTRLDRLEDLALYRATWPTETESLVNGINESGGTILSARGDGNWTFDVRFSDHADLTTFQNYLRAHDINVHIHRITTLSGTERGVSAFDLTDEQREALVLAVSRGYFEVPREVDLTEVAEEFGITRQSASELVRRGANTVLRKVLLED